MNQTDRKNILAIIPARAGSKGIPNKNLMPVGGKPLIEWIIDAAKGAVGAQNVVVSSDGEQILDVAKRNNVGCHLRSEETSSDTATSESALLEVINHVGASGSTAKQLLFLQCTSPLTTEDDLLGLIDLHNLGNFDSSFTACSNHGFIWENVNGEAQGMNHDKSVRLRRQDMQPQFRENGAAYLMNTEGFLKHQHRFFGKTGIYEMSESRSWEIDSLFDAKFIESIMKESTKRNPQLDSLKAIILDFDGVLTDNAVILSETGIESVRCSRSDGMGIEQARKNGLEILILSKEQNVVVAERAKKLKVPVIHGVDDKPTVLQKWLDDHKMDWSQIAFVGNDINDIGCMQRASVGVAVNDAVDQTLQSADIVLTKNGGHGAVREFIEMVLTEKELSKT